MSAGTTVNPVMKTKKSHADKEKELRQAVKSNDVSMVTKLLSQGVNASAKGLEDETPLHVAASNNVSESHYMVAETLLEFEADVNARCDWERTPLYFLVSNRATVRMVRLFLKYGARVDMVDTRGQSLLFPAVQNNKNVKVLKLLIEKGLDVNQENYSKMSPLHYAASYNSEEGHARMIEVLLSYKANINARNDLGLTPFWYLVKKCNTKMVELFLNSKADLYAVSKKGYNLMFPAVYWNPNVEVVELLHYFGLNVNQRSRDGESPLHWACQRLSNMNTIKFLLENGCNMNAADHDGVIPIIEALNFYDLWMTNDEEMMKKKLNFLMVHTDFAVMHDGYNILTFKNETRLQYFRKMLLEHLAKLQALNISVHPDILNAIEKDDNYNDIYNQCLAELLRANNLKLRNSRVSFYNLLVDGKKKVKNYAGNKDLINHWKKSDCEEDFPIYGASMKKNMKKGMIRRTLYDKSLGLLSKQLPIFDPFHLVLRDVLDCITSMKDLSQLCKLKRKK